jgi:hypothetical protein
VQVDFLLLGLVDGGFAMINKYPAAVVLTVAFFPVQELLQKDFDMLNFFKTDPACRVQVQGPAGPQMYEPRWALVLPCSQWEMGESCCVVDACYMPRCNSQLKLLTT